MSEIRIVPIDKLTLRELSPLIDESLAEGYGFIRKLWDEYDSGTNRFETSGAFLMGAFDGEGLIGIGGIQADPYLKRPEVGRVRHVYVLHAYRRQGVGKLLLERLIERARGHFGLLTLRTQTESAADFYEAIGFENSVLIPDASHFLRLKDGDPEINH